MPKERNHRSIGFITQGALSSGLEMRVESRTSVEDLRVGRFVVIEGQNTRFFSLLTDVQLAASTPRALHHSPHEHSLIKDVLAGTSTYVVASLQPMLMLEQTPGKQDLLPVKTIPGHFAPVYEAKAEDFALVFGQENEKNNQDPFFNIGCPLNMEIPICLNLGRFIERSNGVFGKSGTGKSFLTRILLCGLIQKNLASTLIFDMHNEYGWQAISENKGHPRVKGLKQLFPSEVVIYSLDAESSRSRGVADAKELYIGYDQLQIEDLELLKVELALSEATLENAYIVKERLGNNWISTLLEMSSEEIEEFTEIYKGHPAAIKTLQRRLNTVVKKTSYLKPHVSHNYIDEILQFIQAGKHIILEFGRQNNLLSYMLAANVITRRLHANYVRLSEHYLADPDHRRPPRKLTIVIEEAHKFLSPQLARQTIFGIIAREMRKYFVTLLVVDQRPSGIDPEVLSQIGTRVTSLLNDEKDIDAVFTGVPGGNALKTVLAQLDPKQQALLLGYAVPMPVVIRTRAFDTNFYATVGRHSAARPNEVPAAATQAEKAEIELFGSS